jgi:hypothetical protein
MNFGCLLIFLGLNKLKNEFLIPRTVSGRIRFETIAHRSWRPATRDRPKGWLGLGLVARSGGGAAGELAGATWRARGMAVWGGAHPSGGAAWRRWRMLRAMAFIGGEGAMVAGGDGGTTLLWRRGREKVREASNGDNSGG